MPTAKKSPSRRPSPGDPVDLPPPPPAPEVHRPSDEEEDQKNPPPPPPRAPSAATDERNHLRASVAAAASAPARDGKEQQQEASISPDPARPSGSSPSPGKTRGGRRGDASASPSVVTWPPAARSPSSSTPRPPSREDDDDGADAAEQRWWMRWYKQLMIHRAVHGHCRVAPPGQLNGWVQLMRNLRLRGTLSDERIKLLDKIGFEWVTMSGKATVTAGAVDEKKEEKKKGEEKKNKEVKRPWQRRTQDGRKEPPRSPPSASEKGNERRDRRSIKELRNDPWDRKLEELCEYKAEHGHCDVGHVRREVDPDRCALYHWVQAQRRKNKEGTLSADKVRRLARIGFGWKTDRERSPRSKKGEEKEEEEEDEREKEEDEKETESGTKNKKRGRPSIWKSRFEQLRRYREEHGHCRVPYISSKKRKKDDDGDSLDLELVRLSDWVRRMRVDRAKGALPEERMRLLDEIGFDWSPAQGDALASTPATQEGEKKKKEREEDDQWNRKLEELRQYKAEHGHCNVRSVKREVDPDLFQLYRWVQDQRRRRREGTLSESGASLLDEMGFQWTSGRERRRAAAKARKKSESPLSSSSSRRGGGGDRPTWTTRFEELRRYKEEHGHCRVPRIVRGRKRKKDGDGFPDPQLVSLGNWVRRLRTARGGGSLSEDRVRQLDGIGFDWSPRQSGGAASASATKEDGGQDDVWDRRLEELRRYRAEHGHCRVPYTTKEADPDLNRLYNWTLSQRRSGCAEKLSEERRRRLDEVGFEWESARDGYATPQAGWAEKFEELKRYREEHGDCRISTKIPKEDALHNLSRFVMTQRKDRRSGALSEERIRLLDGIGFDWNPNKSRSEELFTLYFLRLQRFKAEHGHCRVPEGYAKDKKLSSFVQRMRHSDHKNSLTPEKRDMLLELGFEFKVRPDRRKKTWEERFNQLKEFWEENGHCNVPCKYNKVLLLPKWVKEQREQYRMLFQGQKSKLTMQQHRMLEDLGFDFEEKEKQERCSAPWTFCTCDLFESS